VKERAEQQHAYERYGYTCKYEFGSDIHGRASFRRMTLYDDGDSRVRGVAKPAIESVTELWVLDGHAAILQRYRHNF
jgi:hypothetical protein